MSRWSHNPEDSRCLDVKRTSRLWSVSSDEPKLDSISLGTYRLGLYASPTHAHHGHPDSVESLKGHVRSATLRTYRFPSGSIRPNLYGLSGPLWSRYPPIGQVEAVKAGLEHMPHRFLLSESDGLAPIARARHVSRILFVYHHTEKIPRIRAAIDFLQRLTL